LFWFASSAEGPDVLVVLASQGDVYGVSAHLFCDQVLCFIEVLIGVTENLEFVTATSTKLEIRVSSKPLTGKSVLQKNRITSLNSISIGFKTDLRINVLNLPNGVNRAVKHKGGLLLS
jgi:hypothetical protein